jgi:hypothetical protein
MSCLIRDNLHMRAYLQSKEHLLTPALKEIRQTRTERPLQWQAENGQENILFRNEKIFTIKEQYNRQNEKIYAQISCEAKEKVPRVQRGHHPSYIMIWWRVSHQGVTPLHFCKKGVKTGAQVYQEHVLQGVAKPLNGTLFNGQKWVFQQDSDPAHKVKTAQEWLRRHILAFISAQDWPSGSPDLNPLGYKLWAVLEDMACQKHHNNLDSLKRSLVKAAAEILLETVRAAIAVWPESLKACITAQGGHFEWHYYK